jgi:uncharacterized protein (TIGR02996 family)
MSNSESAALLAAVLAAPDDDAPRLIFADWLDEHGRPDRAAFIRLQIEFSRLPAFDPHREVVARQADRLFDRHGSDWVAELPQLGGISWTDFDRGFPRAVSAKTLTVFERAAPRIWEVAPIDTLEINGPDARTRLRSNRTYPLLRRLRVRHLGLIGDRAEEFFHSELLDPIESLDVTGLGLGNEGVAALIRGGRFGRLRELVLDKNSIGSAALEALARVHGLRRLTRLSIRGEGGFLDDDDPIIRGGGLEALARSHVFSSLESLDLSGNDLDDEAVSLIVQSTHLVNLRELNLANNDLSGAALEVLEEDGWEVRFESLDLSRNPIGDRGARRLAESEVCNELVRLTLDHCDLGPDGAEALAAADWFPALRSLSLNENAIGPGIRAIAKTGASLAELRLRNNDLASAGARALSGSPAMAGLEILDVSSNGLGSAGVRTIGTSPHIRKLAVLDVASNGMPREAGLVEPAAAALATLARTLIWLRLDWNHLDAPGIVGLIDGVEWSELTELDLRHCGINRAALAYMARDGQLPSLTRVSLRGNLVDANTLGDMLRAPFASGLSHLDLSNNRLASDGLRLIAAGKLPRLRWLSVAGNNIRAGGFTALVRSESLPRLTTVRYTGNLTAEGAHQLSERFPGTEDWPEPSAVFDDEVPF